MRLLLAAAVIAVSGCATIDPHTPPPADWPRLQVRVHEVGLGTMLSKCYPTLSTLQKVLGFVPLGCAWFDLARKTCDVYLTSWAPRSVLEHELEHCEGRDHLGETALADHLRAWRAAGGR